MPTKILLDNDEDIIKKWELFVSQGVLNKNGLRDIISQSWERSKLYGIDPFKENFSIELTKDDLKNKYKEFLPLLETAKPLNANTVQLNTKFRFYDSVNG